MDSEVPAMADNACFVKRPGLQDALQRGVGACRIEVIREDVEAALVVRPDIVRFEKFLYFPLMIGGH